MKILIEAGAVRGAHGGKRLREDSFLTRAAGLSYLLPVLGRAVAANCRAIVHLGHEHPVHNVGIAASHSAPPAAARPSPGACSLAALCRRTWRWLMRAATPRCTGPA